MPTVASTYIIVITGYPRVTITWRRIGWRVAVCIGDRRWRWGVITVGSADSHSYEKSGTGEYATTSQQKKGKNFCFHNYSSPFEGANG
jgi:hypothetical protein